MMKSLSFFTGCAISLILLISSGAEARLFEISGGISKSFNSQWTESMFSMNEKLSYRIDTTEYTVVEGKICNGRTGLALGVNADINNNYVGKANQIAGYIGFKRLYLRYQSGSICGSTIWNGTLAPGQTKITPFNGSVTHVDLLYWRRKIPMYLGVGYTAYQMPMEVMTTFTRSNKENQVKGVPFLDPDYRGEYYAFLFGYDSFTSSLLYYDTRNDLSETDQYVAGVNKNPWGMYFVSQDRFGFGNDRVSRQSLDNAQALNQNRTPVGDSFFSTYLENTTSLGIRWRGISKYGRMAVGLGYELAFFMTLDMIGGAAEKPGDLGIMPSSSLARHGPVARLYVQW